MPFSGCSKEWRHCARRKASKDTASTFNERSFVVFRNSRCHGKGMAVAQSHCSCTIPHVPLRNTINIMKIIALLLTTLSVAAAFAPAPTTVRSSTELNALFDAVSRTGHNTMIFFNWWKIGAWVWFMSHWGLAGWDSWTWLVFTSPRASWCDLCLVTKWALRLTRLSVYVVYKL